MNKTMKIWLIGMAIIGVVLSLFLYISVKISQYYTRNLYERVKNNEKRFVYETYLNTLNPVLYVKDLSDTSSLIHYYKKLANRDTASAYITFEINYMPLTLYQPIYVYKDLGKNANIIELIDFNKECWGYIRGYVYKPITYKGPPSKRLIEEERNYQLKKNSSKEEQKINLIYKKMSDYGWYCNE